MTTSKAIRCTIPYYNDCMQPVVQVTTLAVELGWGADTVDASVRQRRTECACCGSSTDVQDVVVGWELSRMPGYAELSAQTRTGMCPACRQRLKDAL